MGKRQGTNEQIENSIDDIFIYHFGVRRGLVDCRIPPFAYAGSVNEVCK